MAHAANHSIRRYELSHDASHCACLHSLAPSPAGTESVNGQQCNIWRGAVPKGSYTNTMMLSANVNTNWPVLWNATVTDAKGRTAAIVSVRFHSDFAPAHPPKRLVLPPDRCFGPGFLCAYRSFVRSIVHQQHEEAYSCWLTDTCTGPGAGVQTMPMVRLHDEVHPLPL